MKPATATARGSGSYDRLHVLLPPRADWPSARTASSSVIVRWLAPGTAGRAGASGEATLATLPPHRSVWLLFDDRDVFATRLSIPRLSDAKLRLALPALLEERTLADPADSHFVWRRQNGKTGDTETVAIAAIDRAFLRRVLEAFEAAAVRLAGASSVASLLEPLSEARLQVLVNGSRAVARLDGDEAYGFALADAATALDLIRARVPGVQLRWQILSPPPEGTDLAALTGSRQTAAWTGVIDALDLLQGDFAASNRWGRIGSWIATARQSGSWRAPAAWLGVCALIAIGGLNAYWWKLSGQQAQLRTQLRQTFRDAFPGEPAIDELAQAQQAVARLRARAGQAAAQDFTVLQARAAQLMATAPVGAVAAID